LKKSSMRKILKFLCALLFISGGLVIAAVAVSAYLNSPPEKGAAEPILFEVKQGSTVSDIADELKQHDSIRSSLFFKIITRLYNTEGAMKKGLYRIEPVMTATQIHDMLNLGSQKLIKITLPEGWTARKIGIKLESAEICTEDDFLQAVQSPEVLKDYGIPAESAEGYLAPDTYLFQQKYPAEKVVRHLIDTFFQSIEEIEPDYKTQAPEDIHEKVIIASIVEREYRDPAETGKIASVFYNRMSQNMRLQSCATVVYALTEELGREHPSVITYDDLEVESLFNTYRHWGLPPAPIANPGTYALEGVFHPEDTEYLYFLLKNPDAGQHVFSKTLADHNNAYRLYIKK